jgi:hypothetical protein
MCTLAYTAIAEKPHRLPLKLSAVDPQRSIHAYPSRRYGSSPTGITPIIARDKACSHAPPSARISPPASSSSPRTANPAADLGDAPRGASAQGRPGFQRLLAEVTMHHVGLVLGLEMSRLARSAKDWHPLLEVCALFGTLRADQDGVDDASDPNDRLWLGLQGTRSDVALHTMRQPPGAGTSPPSPTRRPVPWGPEGVRAPRDGRGRQGPRCPIPRAACWSRAYTSSGS